MPSLPSPVHSETFFNHLRTTDRIFRASGSDSFHAAHPLLELIYILFLGSTGSNRAEIEGVFLRIEEVIPDYNHDYFLRRLIHSSESSAVGYGSGIAVLEKSFKLKENFTNEISEIFKARTFDISYLSDKEKVSHLNKFIEEETRHMIKDFFSESDLRGTSLVIFNALFFSLKWRVPFDPELTENGHHFRTYCGEKRDSRVDMMRNPEIYVKVRRGEKNSGFTMFELEFKDQEMTAVFLMPHKGIQEFEKKYDAAEEVRKFAEEGGVEWRKANVGLPRMTITHKERLKGHLQEKLGLDEMFRRSEVETEKRFGNMSENNLWVDQIMQAGTIEVNETGVKVAVATAVTMMTCSACMEEPIRLVLESEFLILFQYRGGILFKGYFYNREGNSRNAVV